MWESALTVTVIATLAMVSPGPDFVLVVKNAARHSRQAALMTTLGINLGIAVHMSYCILGLALIIAQTPWLFGLLKYAGAGYLIWIGVQALFSRADALGDGPTAHPRQPVSLRRAFWEGLLCNLLNPKATLFFFSVFTQLLRPDSSLAEKALIGPDHPAAGGGVLAAGGAGGAASCRAWQPAPGARPHRPPAGRGAGGAGRQGWPVVTGGRARVPESAWCAAQPAPLFVQRVRWPCLTFL